MIESDDHGWDRGDEAKYEYPPTRTGPFLIVMLVLLLTLGVILYLFALQLEVAS